MKAYKPKPCAVCRAVFTPVRGMQKVCSPGCVIDHQALKRADARKKADRALKKELKSRAQWMREAQASFNRFIRLRDASDPCISCGRFHGGQYHAGHYRTTAAAPDLRFDEDNCHKQCAPCNNHLSGNVVSYRQGLVSKVGSSAVDRIEGPHEAQRWNIDDLREIKATYQAKCKELEA